MKVLDLFSGIGGFSLGLERAGMETVAFCEIDPFCRKVLNKHWPDIPIHEDIRTLDGEQYRGTVDVVAGGFPCQAHSSAARGRNTAVCLWPEFARIVGEIRPRFVLAENVSAAPWASVVSDLEKLGYGGKLVDLSMPFRRHIRRRVYAMAHANGESEPWGAIDAKMACLRADADRLWPTLPESVGMDDGVSSRVDRLRALGNAVVPQIPEIIGKAIMEQI